MSTCSVGCISTPKAEAGKEIKPSRVYNTQTKVQDYDSDSTQDFEQDLVQIEELSHPIKDNFNLREDVVSEDINRESLQKTSNKTEDGFYLVPKVIE